MPIITLKSFSKSCKRPINTHTPAPKEGRRVLATIGNQAIIALNKAL